MASFKYAGTDIESKNKLKEMLNRIENSKHECQLYKDIDQSIDTDKI